MFKNILLVLCISFITVSTVSANSKEDYYEQAIELIIDIKGNYFNDEVRYDEFLALKLMLFELSKENNIKNQKDVNSKIITNVAIGMNTEEVFYYNQALLILQMVYGDKASSIIYLTN